MNLLALPWLELSLLVSLIGAACASRLRDPLTASRWGLAFTGVALAGTVLACAGYYAGAGPVWELFPRLAGQRIFALDDLNAPLLPVIALLHFLTGLATARTKLRKFSFAWSLSEETLRLATFACLGPWSAVNTSAAPGWYDLLPPPADPHAAAALVAAARLWFLISLLAVGSVSPILELRSRRSSIRVCVLHLGLFVALLVLGGALTAPGADKQNTLTCLPFLAAVLIRCGTVPVHAWLTDWFENATFGNAILYVAPLSGVYAALRLVLPVAPEWVLHGLEVMSLVTAIGAAGLAVVQKDIRRFCAYLFLSQSSLVLVGLEQHDAISLTGSLSLWLAVTLALGGFGLTLRALEARFGRLMLDEYKGLYNHSPTLAVCFLLTGLASVGFPGTIGFVAVDLLVDGAVKTNVFVGLGVVVATAINGIAVVRAYFLLFTGTTHRSSVSLAITPRERFAVLTLAALILGGGLFPQPNITSRHRAAEAVIQERQSRLNEPPHGE